MNRRVVIEGLGYRRLIGLQGKERTKGIKYFIHMRPYECERTQKQGEEHSIIKHSCRKTSIVSLEERQRFNFNGAQPTEWERIKSKYI